MHVEEDSQLEIQSQTTIPDSKDASIVNLEEETKSEHSFVAE